MNERMNEVLANMSGPGAVVSRPRGIASGREIGFTVAAPIMGGIREAEVMGAVVAVVYFKSSFNQVQQTSAKSEQEILDEGLPLVFVVDSEGRAVAHPDDELAFSERQMNELKVVQEWMQTGAQVESALAPFTLERNGQRIDLLGAYATAKLDNASRLGVIAIQDERTALYSVTEMRRENKKCELARSGRRASHRLFLR
ncbi:MAG: hypothetical protein WKF84_13215 [Pyrinomonadaceae bacterium]